MSISNMSVKEITDEIKKRLISLEYRPGQLIKETDLAAEFHVSRTPIREALQKLEFDGWVVIRPRNGTYVTEVDLHYLRNAFDLRRMMDHLSLEYAVQYATDADIQELYAIGAAIAQAKAAQQSAEYLTQESFYFRRLIKIHNNVLLQEMFQNITEKMHRCYNVIFPSEQIKFEHLSGFTSMDAITAAIEQRDLPEAKRLMDCYIQSERDLIKQYIL